MKSFDNCSERRVAIVPMSERYGAWSPNLVLDSEGRLLCKYGRMDFEREVRQTVLITSTDRGRTWGEPRLLEERPGLKTARRVFKQWGGACLNILSDGRLVLIDMAEDEATFQVRWSRDDGRTWSERRKAGRGAPAVMVKTASGDLVVAAAVSAYADPKVSTVKHRVLQFRSRDDGRTWEGPQVIAEDPIFNLAEPTMAGLRDGRLMCIIRENSYNFYPAYKTFSQDEGETWSPIAETPMLAHQAILGQLQSGRILVTYRHTGEFGAAWAWLGDPDDPTDYQVTATKHLDVEPSVQDGFLRIKTGGDDECLRYHLRAPDNEQSEVRLSAELRCLSNEGNACAFHVAQAGWVAIYPDHVELPDSGGLTAANDSRDFRRYEIRRDARELTVSVDGEQLVRTDRLDRGKVVDNLGGHIPFKNYNAFGTLGQGALGQSARGEAHWRSVGLAIKNPIHRDYDYEWDASSGRLPNQYEEDRIIEIDNNFGESAYHIGQTSWVQFPDGEIFVASNYTYFRPDGRRGGWLKGCYLREDDFEL